jgi:hypothetical protein
MVKGSPGHMRDTHSFRWSVGCHVIMWRYNTQMHCTLGNVPFCLMFGQSPCVGISSLLPNADLINTLSTKAQINHVIEYEDMVDAWDDDPPIHETAADAVFEAMMTADLNGAQEAVVVGEETAVDGDKAAAINAQEVVTDLFGAAAASGCAVAAGSQNNNDSSGDSDDDLTLDQLGQHAQRNECLSM